MHSPSDHRTLVLTRGDVQALLPMGECIDAVEHAFRQHARGQSIRPGVLGSHVERGGFHVKTAGMLGANDAERPTFVAKINANFPENPTSRGLPTIQGVVVLFDAADGRPLAILDSMEITTLRTAAASAVAARYLARAQASTVTICGCGEQGPSQLRALTHVRPIRQVFAFDIDFSRAERYASDMALELDLDVTPLRDLGNATHDSDIWVTCTPAHQWFLGREHVRPGAFVAAVGADNPHKQEIEPALLASSTVVADVLDQCASIGDLHHAIEAGVLKASDVHAELADVVAGRARARASDDEIIIFDSTGTALEDVAAAKLVYERALAAGAGTRIGLGSAATMPNVVLEGRP